MCLHGLLKVLGAMRCVKLVVKSAGVAKGLIVGGSTPEWCDGDATVLALYTHPRSGLDSSLGGLARLGHLDGLEVSLLALVQE